MDWQTVSPAAAGFAPDLALRLDAGIRSGLLRDQHAVLAARNGRIVLERYGAGADENWGGGLGVVLHGKETLHDLRSVTKSVVGLLYGIALAQGRVPPPEAPLYAQFPEHADLAGEPGRAAITVGHALSMTLGLEWDESSIPYTNPANSEIAMESAPDRLRFILSRPVVVPPGTRWTYCGGATALLGGLVARGTGMTLEAFAQASLFAPLGIGRFEWAGGDDGVASAASGLRLSARDLARIGEIMRLGGGPVVPADWIARATRPAIPTGDGLEYGFQWFLGSAPAAGRPRRWVAGFGNGGQRLWLVPELGLTVVHFSGAYNRPDSWITPTRIFREIVLANLQAA
jgi:CubicO group peptidase (beta-lactamase class C family)